MTDAPRPRRNRVTPFGTIEAVPEKGMFMGNRGRLLGPAGALVRQWATKAWIACKLSHRRRRVTFDDPDRYTPLFFHDEAVALAAGHRPCAECRPADYQRFKRAWAKAHGLGVDTFVSAKEIDDRLHRARFSTYFALMDTLPDGCFAELPSAPCHAALIWQGHAHVWSPQGYRRLRATPVGLAVSVLTPAPTVALLRAGYIPRVEFLTARPVDVFLPGLVKAVGHPDVSLALPVATRCTVPKALVVADPVLPSIRGRK